MNTPLVDVQDLLKIYRRGRVSVEALKGISLSVQSGEVLGLLGPNGSGKSTFVRSVSGLITPERGVIRWKGQPARHREIARHMGLLLEGRGAANDRLSTLENARYFCTLREHEFRSDFFQDLIQILEIPDPNCPVRQYSTGIKLRVSLLVTLIHQPSLVLFDEPTLGLDALGVERLEQLINRMSTAGVAFVLCSHDLHFIERLCRRIACLHDGEIIFDGRKEDFAQRDYQYRSTIGFRCDLTVVRALGRKMKIDKFNRCEFKLVDNVDLSEFLQSISHLFDHIDHFEIRPFDLREKYLSMLEAHSALQNV